MKKPVVFFIFLILLAELPALAQKKTEVFLKFSRQEGLMRIVLESEEPFIARAQTSVSAMQAKIDFPETFHLNAPKTVPFEIVQNDKTLLLNLREKGEIKTFRLTAPSRVVLDVSSPEIHALKPADFIYSNTFVIDAGHGGYDFGMTFRDRNEKDISLEIAKELSAFLAKKGKKVFLTRKVDQYMTVSERSGFLNQKKPDIFISIHISGDGIFAVYSPRIDERSVNEATDAYNIETRQKKVTGKSRILAESLVKALKEEFKEHIVLREMPLPLLNSSGSPAVLLELPSPAAIVYDQQKKTKIVNAIIRGITIYGQ